MSVDLFEVDNPEDLQEAIHRLPAGEHLTYQVAGGEQVCLLMVKDQHVYYCNLDCRPSNSIERALVDAGFDPKKIENINETQRNADLAQGYRPTNMPVSREEAIRRLKWSVAKSTQSLEPEVGAPARTGTRFSRMVDTFFRKKRTLEETHSPGKTSQHKF